MGDEADERPIWITVWGGANPFGQTLWRVKSERTAEPFKDLVRRFRIYYTLGASMSREPEGDKLSFEWWVYAEAGSYASSLTIANNTANKVTVNLLADSAGKTIHVICEVGDAGTPALASYRRIVLQPGG